MPLPLVKMGTGSRSASGAIRCRLTRRFCLTAFDNRGIITALDRMS